MANRKSPRVNRALLAVGIISSVCAVAASYLYFASPDATLSSSARPQRRRTILVSAASRHDFLTHIPESAKQDDEVYFVHLESNPDGSAELDGRCAYLLRHEKVEGLTHIARHMAPDVLIVLPSMAGSANIADIKDWVGKVIVVHDTPLTKTEATNDTDRVKHITLPTPYAEFFK